MPQVTPLSDFQHGDMSFRRGVSAEISETLADDLVRAKLAEKHSNKMEPPVVNKAAEAPSKALVTPVAKPKGK